MPRLNAPPDARLRGLTPTVEASVFAVCNHWLDLGSEAPLGVAVSGGGDSVALLVALTAWGRRRLIVYCVDHGLNPAAQQWSQTVEVLADRLGAVFRPLKVTEPFQPSGIQAQARHFRHARIAEAAREDGVNVVAFGHTQDDLEESDWMRAEGTALGRLRPFGPSPAWPEGRGVFILRPLLGLKRQSLRDWLRAGGMKWVDDPANSHSGFARVRARQALSQSVAVMPAAPSHEGLDEAVWHSLVRDDPSDRAGLGLVLEAEALCALSPRLRRRVLSALSLSYGGGGRPPRGIVLDGLDTLLTRRVPDVRQAAGTRFCLDDETLKVRRAPADPRRHEVLSLTLKAGTSDIYDGRIWMETHEELSVRPLRQCGINWRRDLSPDAVAGLAAMDADLRMTWPMVQALKGEDRAIRPLGLDSGSEPAFSGLSRNRLRSALGLIRHERDILA